MACLTSRGSHPGHRRVEIPEALASKALLAKNRHFIHRPITDESSGCELNRKQSKFECKRLVTAASF
jgi:hypothetical protein